MVELMQVLRVFWPLILFQLVLMIWALVDLSRRQETKVFPKVAWVFIIIFINAGIGAIAYFIFGRGEKITSGGSRK